MTYVCILCILFIHFLCDMFNNLMIILFATLFWKFMQINYVIVIVIGLQPGLPTGLSCGQLGRIFDALAARFLKWLWAEFWPNFLFIWPNWPNLTEKFKIGPAMSILSF